MTPKTSSEYQKLAKHFFNSKIKGDVSIEKIRASLLLASREYRPAYWRRLRCAIKHTLLLRGKTNAANIIGAAKNPITSNQVDPSVNSKPKQKRVKKVTQDEHLRLLRHFRKRCDGPLMGAIQIAWLLGCRPAEMPHIQLQKNGRVFIPSAKKTADGIRGKDRTVRLNEYSYNLLKHALVLLKLELKSSEDNGSVGIHRLQRRLQTATHAIWPKRKHQISLYSYRHQMGSDLKASKMSPETIALIMGHQSVRSIDKYGDRRFSNLKVHPLPSIHELRSGPSNSQHTLKHI